MSKKENQDIYSNVFIEAGPGGWVLRVKNGPPEVFIHWDRLIRRLELLLTSKGDPEK